MIYKNITIFLKKIIYFVSLKKSITFANYNIR